jgi:membrane fusion protein (multidrug efflux system)
MTASTVTVIEETATTATTTRQPWMKVGAGVLALALAAGGAYFWHQSSLYVSSTNAYVNANVVKVAPLVTGEVVAVPVVNNQMVKAGDLLAQVDPQPYQLALAQAQAQLAQVRENAASALVSEREAEADIAAAQATLEQARRDAGRMQELLVKHYVSPDMADKARTAVTTGTAQVQVAVARRDAARLS